MEVTDSTAIPILKRRYRNLDCGKLQVCKFGTLPQPFKPSDHYAKTIVSGVAKFTCDGTTSSGKPCPYKEKKNFHFMLTFLLQRFIHKHLKNRQKKKSEQNLLTELKRKENLLNIRSQGMRHTKITKLERIDWISY